MQRSPALRFFSLWQIYLVRRSVITHTSLAAHRDGRLARGQKRLPRVFYPRSSFQAPSISTSAAPSAKNRQAGCRVAMPAIVTSLFPIKPTAGFLFLACFYLKTFWSLIDPQSNASLMELFVFLYPPHTRISDV